MKTIKLFLLVLVSFLTSSTFSQNLAVYVSDAGNFSTGPWQIAKFDEDGTYEGALMSDEDGIVWPQDIVFLDSEEAVLISNLSAEGIISKHEWDTGDPVENFSEGLGGPTRMKVGPDGLLYVLQWSSTDNKVLRFELDGTFVDEFTQVGVPRSIGIDWDNNGDLYVSSYGGNTVHKFDGVTGADLGLFIDQLAGPTNIFFEPDGDLIVFNYNGGTIQRYDSAGNFVEDLISGVNGCEGYAFFPNGDLLIGVGSDGSIRRYDSDYNFIENFVEPGILATPNAIVIRNNIPLSVPENSLELVLVTPTVGSNFRLNSQLASFIKELKVYNTAGALVTSIVPTEALFWNAGSLSEGLYFIVAEENGIRHRQKIIVKKQ